MGVHNGDIINGPGNIRDNDKPWDVRDIPMVGSPNITMVFWSFQPLFEVLLNFPEVE
jgi:hypothetical protein